MFIAIQRKLLSRFSDTDCVENFALVHFQLALTFFYRLILYLSPMKWFTKKIHPPASNLSNWKNDEGSLTNIHMKSSSWSQLRKKKQLLNGWECGALKSHSEVTKGFKVLTRIWNVIPIRRVKLIVPGQNLQEEVLVTTVRVLLVAVVVERRVSGQAGE